MVLWAVMKYLSQILKIHTHTHIQIKKKKKINERKKVKKKTMWILKGPKIKFILKADKKAE